MGFFLFDFIKFLYNDIKTDIIFILELLYGERKIKINKEQLEELKDWRGILKENWLLFILVIAAFCAGYFFATVILNNACAAAVEQWVIETDLYTKLGTSKNFTQEILNIPIQ